MTEIAAAAQTQGDGRPSDGWLSSRPWLMLTLLMLIGVLNLLDRILPSILAEPIKRDLQLSDTELGLINGLGFLLIYAVAGIPLARLSDRGHYSLVISMCLAAWSAMTMMSSWVTAGWQLAITRVGVAVGEAGGTPAAHAFITRNFPAHRRTAALAMFTLCLPLGSMAGFAVGGYLGDALGWRRTFLAMGLLGIGLSLFTYFALPSGKVLAASLVSSRESKPWLRPLIRKRSFTLIVTGCSLIAMGGYTAIVFGAAFLIRRHGMSLSGTGLQIGLISGSIGVVSLLAAGWLSDRLSMRDDRWLLGVVILMALASLPFSIAAITSGDQGLAVLGIAINCAFPTAALPPVVSALHRLTPIDARSTASAILLAANALLGGIGPLLTGVISDALQPTHGADSLGYGLLLVPSCFILGALFYFAALFTYRSDLARSEQV